MPTGTCSKLAIVDELDFVAFMGVVMQCFLLITMGCCVTIQQWPQSRLVGSIDQWCAVY